MRSRLRLRAISYAVRLAAAFTGVGLAAAKVTAILVNLSFNALLGGYLSTQQEERQRAVAAVFADSYEREAGWQPAALDRLGAELLPDGGSIRLLDASDRQVWSYATSSSAGAIHRELMAEGALGAEQSLPIMDRGSRVGTALVRLPTPGVMPHDREFRAAVNRMLLVGGLVGGLLALGLEVLVAGRATRPVRELTRAATALAEGQTGRRIRIASDREFSAMADAFNGMAETIEAQEEVRRAYASEVAHELRTPLMIQRSQLEAMEEGMIEPGPTGFRSLLEENQRLGRLVADLEVLGSAEAARFSLQRREIDLARAVREAAAGLLVAIRGQGYRLLDRRPASPGGRGPGARRPDGRQPPLQRAQTHPAGRQRVRPAPSDRPWAVLEVRDSGRGIAEEDLPRVFERFYRGRRPRGRGSGIGLAVVRELAEAHGGHALVENPPGTGALFRVVLPAQPSPGPEGQRLQAATSASAG